MPIELMSNSKRSAFLRALASLTILALGLGLTYFSTITVQRGISDRAHERAALKFEQLEDAVQAQFRAVNDGIRGLKGLYAASGKLERRAFGAWVSSHDMAFQYPGVKAFGWIQKSDHTQGSPGAGAAAFVLQYLEPAYPDQPQPGLDLSDAAFSREAIARALQFGKPVLTRAGAGDAPQPWGAYFLYLVPLYTAPATSPLAEAQKPPLLGLLVAPLVMEQLLGRTRISVETVLDHEVFDGANAEPSARVFSSLVAAGQPAQDGQKDAYESRRLHFERTLLIDGHVFLLRAASSTAFEADWDQTTPQAIALAGALASLLLAWTVWLLLSGQARVQAQAQSLTHDLERLARVVKSTTHVVIVGNPDGTISWVNDAFVHVTGVAVERAVGTRFVDLFDLKQVDSASRDLFRSTLENRESLRLQLPWLVSNGQKLWFDVDLQTEQDASGEFLGYIAIASNITAQRNAGEQLAAAVRENQQLMDAIDRHSIVSITDHQGNIVYANDMFTRVSGYSREELIGQNHRVVKSSHQPTAYWTAMWKLVSSGTTWRATVCNRAKDDRLYWVDTVIAPFFDEAGNIDKYVSIRTDVTESRKAQADLAYEREHLKAIISGTNAGTWEWEVPTGEVTINQRWAEIMGYQAHELGPVNVHTWEKFSHPEDLAVAWELLQRHFAGELPGYESEIRMRHREGHWVWVQVRGKVSSWESAGKPRWVSGIHLDITEQKLLQSTLADKNRVMHSMLENIPVALSVFDADLRLVARNEKFAELLDFPASLFDGSVTTFEQIIRFNAARGEYGTVDVEKSIQSIIDRARNTVDHQFERIRPNGVALEVRGAPMPGGGFVTTYADISQRKAAEAEIARTTSLLQSVLHAASEVAVITIGVDHVITLFNKGAERMLGYRSEELVGKATPAILHDASEVQARASSLSAQLGRTVTGLQVFVDPSQLSKKGEWTYVRKNGERFIVSLVVTALSDSQGTCTGYLGVAYDITQEKDNERWLRAAMEEAEQASSAKGQFLANMSHEIRTPMNAILGMLKLLQNTQLDGRQLDYTTKTENAARSLLSLLNDILDFSKIDAGKMQLDPQPFRLDSLMRNLSVILSASIGNKNIEVLFDIDPSVPATLVGDSLRLQQVLINLGGNAIKFTERGEVVLSITLDRIESDTAHIGFAVRDSGIGIAPENQQRIFAGFSQAEASTTRRFGGTGLGLSISRRLVDLMGGELHINSALGEGSTFYFHIALPLAQEAADDALITMPTQPSQSLSVLVVDDNPQSLRVLATMARSLGWTVDTAVGGEEALRRMEVRSRTGSAPYGAVFMDWRMPGMDGWEATLRIRQLALEPIVPIVIMVTAQDRELLAQRSPQEQSRLNGYLVKPITVTMMQDAFSAACDPQGSSRALASRGRSGAQRLAGMRLLVVEDNLINQQVARELLAAEGASVDLAANGQLGVDAVANAGTPYDAVLMDIQMPVMDGYTACVAIRHELGLHALPIIAMTANAMASDREACLAAGMNDHIGKPFDLPLLIDMLLQQTGWQPPFAGATQAVPAVPAALPGDEPWAEHEAVPPPGTTDTRGAIARFGGNTDLYHQILHSYLEELHTLPSRLDVQVQDGQLAEAARTLHTTKGLSLTVGALHMGAIARRAELCLKSSPAPTAAALQAACGSVREAVGVTIEALQTALAQLQNQQPASVERAPGLALDTPALIADLQRLQAVLEQADLQALELHAGIQRKYGAAVAHSMESLDAMIADFEFAQAVVQCGVLMQLFSATPPP